MTAMAAGAVPQTTNSSWTTGAVVLVAATALVASVALSKERRR